MKKKANLQPAPKPLARAVALQPGAAAPARIDLKEKPQSMSSPEQSHQATPAAEGEGGRSPALRGGAGNVDKIRDILFGTQMRDYDSRFARLEETLVKENAEIRETSKRRFDQLEAFVRKEFETIQAKFKADRDERLDAETQHSRELKDATDALSRRLRDLDDRSSGVERDIRGRLLDQARELNEEIRATHDAIAALLEKRYHELKDGKTDRAALATLFTEVALRLSDEFHIPGSEE
jgi:phage host-nuclease inhibitor protein Gam